MLNKRNLENIYNLLCENKAIQEYEKSQVKNWPWCDETAKLLIKNSERRIEKIDKLLNLIEKEIQNCE